MEAKLLNNNTLLFSYHQSLLNWYHNHKRDLPWRKNPNYYAVWISEIILQQTQVKQGLNYYLRFMQAFPNVEDLAKATEDEVLKLWEGLGYYSRARNLHFGAKQIVELGGFPDSYNAWLKIKGVGPYTAAAISSIVADEAQAVVDGNVQRVISRLVKYETAVNNTQGIKDIQKYAQDLMSLKYPGDYNQAIMELGATVCKPTNPYCGNCPVNSFCLAAELGVQKGLPVKEKKLKVKPRYLHYYVLHSDGHYLLERRGQGDVWEGLYQFPLIETQTEKDLPVPSQLTQVSQKELAGAELLWQGKHILSHQRLYINCWLVNVDVKLTEVERFEWYAKTEVEKLAMPRPLRKVFSEYLMH